VNRRGFIAGAGALAITPRLARAAGNQAWHLPDEGEAHQRTFMQWPVSRQVHPDAVFLEMLQRTIADIANSIVAYEPLVMLVGPAHIASARRRLSSEIEIWDIPTEDLWARDSGPVFVTDDNGRQAVMNLNFNGWGGKQVHRHDGQIAERVAEWLELPLIDSGVTGELGGLDWDGHGTLIAHESSWVNTNRNNEPRALIENRLLHALGARKMIWAPGVAGKDITDYHIDSLARFVAPGEVLIQVPDRVTPESPWAAAALETRNILEKATAANGEKLKLIEIPDPWDTRITTPNFVASYANYYICNGAVIAAQFGDAEADEIAADALKTAFPDREIVTLNVDPLGEVGGGIHCATQQQPAV
jgi:agmatine deiminase